MPGPPGWAGGISNGGTATITASQVDGNTAPGAAGGGILNHGVMTINSSRVTGNTTPADSAGDQPPCSMSPRSSRSPHLAPRSSAAERIPRLSISANSSWRAMT